MTERSKFDPFAPKGGGGERRPRRSTADTELPSWLLDAMRERGVDDAALDPLTAQFERLNPAERASALAELQQRRRATADLDELAAALIEFSKAGVDVDDGPLDDDEIAAQVDAVRARLVELRVQTTGATEVTNEIVADVISFTDRLQRFATAFDLPLDVLVDDVLDALDGSDDALTGYGLQLVAGEPVDRWADVDRQLADLLGEGSTADFGELAAELLSLANDGDDVDAWLAAHPEVQPVVVDGVIVGLSGPSEPATSPQSAAVDATVESTSGGEQPVSDAHSSAGELADAVLVDAVTAADVPKTANEAVAWIGDAPDEDALRARARLVLDVELTYPPPPRKTVRQALDLALGADVVTAAVEARG